MSTVRIHLLEENVINKIAAGEVVERPFNVLKELLENSIDAGAKKIDVWVDEGGKKKIEVLDDGSGLSKDDLILAIKRHATSKIYNMEDLYQIGSMGFRGEALAAISAVSRFTLCSRLAGEEEGWSLSGEGENHKNLSSKRMNVGTKVSVEDLFYNLPPRKQFLKSAAREESACLELLEAFSLAHPECVFRGIFDGKEKFYVEGGNGDFSSMLKKRTNFILDPKNELIYVAEECPYGKVEALFSPPGQGHPTARHIHTYVNKRWVKDKILKTGIMRGYHSHLMRHEYPKAVVHLTCEPSLVDINVHPAKWEVRFQYAVDIQTLLVKAIHQAVKIWASFHPIPHPKPALREESFSEKNISSEKKFSSQEKPFENPWEAPKSVSIPEKVEAEKNKVETFLEKKSSSLLLKEEWENGWKYLGSFAKTYLIFEDGKELKIVDQHGFHERILYEKIKNSLSPLAQKLLIPEHWETPRAWWFEEQKISLNRLGFLFQRLGENSLEIQGVPAFLVDKHRWRGAWEKWDSAHYWDNIPSTDIYHEIMASMACHGAVRGGDILEVSHVKEILKEAKNVDFYHNCPHGRQVIKSFPMGIVEGWFDRT